MTYRTIAVFTLSTALAVVAANAQDKVAARIPFTFRAGKSVLPAGEYTFSTIGPAGTVLVRSIEQKANAMLIANAVQASQRPAGGKLVFHRYGDTYFLSQVWKPGSERGHQFIPTRAEQEMAAAAQRSGGTEVASVPLTNR